IRGIEQQARIIAGQRSAFFSDTSITAATRVPNKVSARMTSPRRSLEVSPLSTNRKRREISRWGPCRSRSDSGIYSNAGRIDWGKKKLVERGHGGIQDRWGVKPGPCPVLCRGDIRTGTPPSLASNACYRADLLMNLF